MALNAAAARSQQADRNALLRHCTLSQACRDDGAKASVHIFCTHVQRRMRASAA
jgi:hypothetical protein